MIDSKVIHLRVIIVPLLTCLLQRKHRESLSLWLQFCMIHIYCSVHLSHVSKISPVGSFHRCIVFGAGNYALLAAKINTKGARQSLIRHYVSHVFICMSSTLSFAPISVSILMCHFFTCSLILHIQWYLELNSMNAMNDGTLLQQC